jgi:hypothetical protein
MVLGHEMFHAIFAKGGKRAMKLYNEAKQLINSEKAKEVEERYKKFYAELGVKESIAESISKEEVSAHGSEEVFKSKEAWEYILGEDSSIGDGVLSFFRKSARQYSEIQQMSARARKFIRHYKKLFDAISARNQGSNSLSLALDGAQRKTPIVDRMGENVKLTGEEDIPRYKTPEEAKLSGEVSDARFSLAFSKDIAEKQREYVDRGYAKISAEELQSAIDVTSAMVDKMLPHADILPQDKVGKTLVKNGSYDVSVENTTICIRTLAYNSFVDMVSEKVGRPLTQMESFLVSQKLYEIAKEPQCLYCYVSLDRKAFNEMIIRYVEQRDAAIEAYKQAGEPKLPSSKDDNFSPYKEFLYDGKSYRKSTQNMWDRYVGWIETYKKGEDLVTLEDIATEARRADIARDGGSKASQVKDMLKYAQSASWAKKQTQYVAYYDEILRLKPQVIRNLNSHYGMRWYSFSDYSGAFIVENMQQITDAAIRGLKGLSYTKDTDFAEIFAPTGMNINVSVYAKKNKDGGYEIDAKQSANIDEAIKLRKKYPNVGIVVVATDAEGVEWALSQEWSDVVIPFHTVRTGADVAEFYNWEIFNAEQSDTVTDQNLWDAYVESVGKKKASKMVYPSEHQNDRDTYLRLCKERGLTPRFKSFLDNPNYMKLVNETRQSESQTSPLKAKFNLEAAERSFDKFVEKGGYYEGWYNDGIDVDGEAEIVAQDVKAGKKANEVSYGRQDIDAEGIQRGRRSNREHGRRFALPYDDILDTESVIFRSEQAKLTSNTAPSSNPDTRYALTFDEDLDAIFGDIDMNADADGASFDIDAVLERGIPRKPGASTLTIGEMKKTIANNTHYQVFSKGKALEVIGRMFGTSDLTAKTRAKLADALWQGFNDCTDVESRQTFAHDMAEFIVATMVTEAKVENPDVMEAQERLSYLSTYIGKITFHPDDLSEIRHIADKAGLKKILGRWGYKGKKGTSRVPMDVFACDIAREMPGMSALEDMHPVEAFMELDAMYERAREDVKDKWISAYWDATDADMLTIVTGIEADIMKAFETEGEQSKFSKLVEGRIEYYSTRAEFWKAEHDRIKGRDRILGLLMSQAQKMKDLRLGTFANATQFDSELFKNSIEKLAKIQFRGNLNVSGTRKIMGELLQWYRKDNPLLEFVDEKNPGLYVQSVADMLESLSEGKKGFSKEELLTMYDVMSYFVKFVENYGKVFRNGKMIEALPEAQRYIGIAQANEGLKVGLFAKLSGSWYAEMFSDPATLVRRMDYYERGFYTEMFEDLREAATDAEIAEMRIMREYDEFLRSNKKYIEKASEELIEYRGQKIPKIQLIDLYMTMKRKHAWAGIAINGFPFKNLEGKVVRVPGFLPDEHISETDLEAAITAQQAEIAKHFTDADRQYMAILEKGYNEDARKLKADRDMQRLGFTNASTDYYYPIRRAYTAQNIDTSDAQAEYDRVTNSSFNKDIVKGAKQEIAIESADARFRRHIHAVCQYAYLSPAIETFNRLYNMDTSGNRNHPISVRTASENVWAKGNKYFMKLISDIQGIPTGSSEGMAALSFIRGSYAKFQLGANPKVWFTQLSSIFASSSILDADSITRGVFLSSEGIDQYCPLAELRSYDNTAAMAQGVLDKQGKARSKAGRAIQKVGKFSDVLMQPIGMMDRFVVCRIFGACQAQVEKNGGAKVGTEANKIEAGKLLRKVIQETQQNSIATERSAAMRSSNEILRTVTMFTSDSMKVIGRVIDAFGEISVLHSKIKAATDPDVKAELKARLKVAQRNARKATTALVLTAVFMAGIAQLFRWLYDKEQKEDETVAQTMLVDAIGNLFGGLPIFKDIYATFAEGYDIDNYAYSAVNDLISGVKRIVDLVGLICENKATQQDYASRIKKVSYAVGQITGLPVRNVYNVLYGLTKRFSPETAYKIDSAFYAKNYQNDLYKAIEDEDAEMASYILSLLYNERMGADISEAVHNELYSLSAKGYKVLPKSAPKSITVEGAEYELNEAQQAAVRGSYSASQASLEKLFTKEKYKRLSEEMKAEAVNYVYELHYNMALEDALGIDRGNAVLISSVIGAENLAMLHVATKGLTSDTDKFGNTISGSKRAKVVAAINQLDVSSEQKLLLICAKGYALKDGDLRGMSAERAKKLLLRYILRMGKLNKQQKSELAALCGFEVRNGRIMLKTPS